MMDSSRVLREIQVLSEGYEMVDYDRGDGVVMVENVTLPPGWNHDNISVMIVLPDTYPKVAPDLYVPEDLRFEGKTPTRMMISVGPDGWGQYDAHPLNNEWRPRRDTIVTLMRLFESWMQRPENPNPWEE